ncbi:MAG: DUF120 domain-containing protein, partial [Nitrosopumilales archaeon]|nr:DUF120 domain-containing protein [Nitrosopumilales archaeon]
SGKNVSVKITAKGYSEMVKISSVLRTSIDSAPSFVELKGTLVSGMGEGAYYMSLKGYTKQFKEKLGYIPFPGTLNVKLSKKEYIETVSQFYNRDCILINGFSDEKRTYGWVKCFNAKYGWVKCFNAKLNNLIDCELVILERTHHDNSVTELISKINIRKTAKLRDGSSLTIKIPIKS